MYLIKDIKKNHAKYQFHFFLFIHCVPYTNTAWTIKEIIGLLLLLEPEIHSSLYLSGGCFYWIYILSIQPEKLSLEEVHLNR